MEKTTSGATLAFHWSYVLLPLVILLLSIIIAVFFYPQLSVEVAYHFKPDGSPDRWLSRSAIILWMLLPQLFFTLLAGVTTWGITKLATLFKPRETPVIKPERIILLMGNMVALPQIIVSFTMLDIFSYNSYQIHLLPLWVFVLTIMGIGGIILGIFFFQAMRQVWGVSKERYIDRKNTSQG